MVFKILCAKSITILRRDIILFLRIRVKGQVSSAWTSDGCVTSCALVIVFAIAICRPSSDVTQPLAFCSNFWRYLANDPRKKFRDGFQFQRCSLGDRPSVSSSSHLRSPQSRCALAYFTVVADRSLRRRHTQDAPSRMVAFPHDITLAWKVSE
jgi:hypothetical protein